MMMQRMYPGAPWLPKFKDPGDDLSIVIVKRKYKDC